MICVKSLVTPNILLICLQLILSSKRYIDCSWDYDNQKDDVVLMISEYNKKYTLLPHKYLVFNNKELIILLS
ncbi:hypothetical protein BD770DRAFT_381799 [Pilaira anomala]|nr:hypothetical protein BD770DRAFT_381799 [Pilaira anomala]